MTPSTSMELHPGTFSTPPSLILFLAFTASSHLFTDAYMLTTRDWIPESLDSICASRSASCSPSSTFP
uniref:Uncharacterized protein n=1 Tax=Kalanchoe fedtschenkoi TaxID=63787 RepID=A0A7N0RB13_KALFE